jgi:hypothetical protein
MNQEEYALMAHYRNQIPAKEETPKGQKFHIGEIVKISKPSSWFSKDSFQKDKCRLYQIEYSYSQKYRGSSFDPKPQYSLKHLFEDNTSAWYDESELSLVKGMDEINEQKDLDEYKRLKEKYEGIK